MGVRESRLQSPAQPLSARAAVCFLHDIRPAGGSVPRLDRVILSGQRRGLFSQGCEVGRARVSAFGRSTMGLSVRLRLFRRAKVLGDQLSA
jgi:hypothetical protein